MLLVLAALLQSIVKHGYSVHYRCNDKYLLVLSVYKNVDFAITHVTDIMTFVSQFVTSESFCSKSLF